MNARPIALSVGDPGGVGPVVSASAVLRLGIASDVVLFGDATQLRDCVRAVDPEVRVDIIVADAIADSSDAGGIRVVDTGAAPREERMAHAASAATGEAQWRALCAAAAAVESGSARAIVTGPVSKEAITLAGHSFCGQTELLAQRSGLADDDVTMMFLGPNLKVSLATTHLSIADVPRAVTPPRVERAINHLAEALLRLGQNERRPRLAVCGLNPHAGEAGLFGSEEIQVIRSATERAALALPGVQVSGPLPAEAVFRAAKSGNVEGVVAMFHDQATIASKLLDWGEAVNVTWGLPFVRTSVDHGVAYDAAQAGTASDDGMAAALQLALELTSS